MFYIFVIVGQFSWTYDEKNNRKAPYNYSVSLSINNFSVLLWDGPNTSSFTISGFGGPIGNFIYGFEYSKNFKVSKDTQHIL